MRILLLTLGMLLYGGFSKAGDDVVLASDINRLVGGYWIGKLTYLDYTSNTRTTIRTGLRVERISDTKPVWRFHQLYPDEPHANESTRVCLSAKGRKWKGGKVIRRQEMEDGLVEIVTIREKGKYVFRYTYRISDTTFSIRKEEALKGTESYIERNTFEYEKEIPVNS